MTTTSPEGFKPEDPDFDPSMHWDIAAKAGIIQPETEPKTVITPNVVPQAEGGERAQPGAESIRTSLPDIPAAAGVDQKTGEPIALMATSAAPAKPEPYSPSTLHQSGAGLPPKEPDLGFSQLSPEQPRRPMRLRTKLIALGAAVLVLAGGIWAAVDSSGSKKPSHSTSENDGVPQPGDVQVSLSAGNGAIIVPGNSAGTSPSNSEVTTPNPEVGIYPDTVSETGQAPGNIYYGGYAGLPSTSVKIGGSEVTIPELALPDTTVAGREYTVQDLGKWVTENLAALFSLPVTSPDFTKLLDAFTDNARVKNTVIQENQTIRSLAPHQETDEVVLFDNASNAVNFDTVGRTDPQGNPFYGVTSGKLYLRYLSENTVFNADGTSSIKPGVTSGRAASFQDARSFTQADSNIVQNSDYQFSVHQVNGRVLVNAFAFGTVG